MRLHGDEKFLLIPVNGIGDNLMFLPLAYRLKEHAPGIRVSMLSNEANGAASLMRHSPWLDDVITYSLESNDTRGYTKYFLLEYPRLVARLATERYDYVLSIVPNVLRRSILRLVRERKTLVNHDRRLNEFEAGHSLLDRFENIRHEYRHPPLLKFLDDQSLLAKFGLEAGRFVVLNFTSKSPARSYPRGTEVLEALTHETPWQFVLGGPGDSMATTANVIDVGNRTTAREIAAIVGRAAACIAIDGGMLYMATAQNVPVIGLFGPVHSSFRTPPDANDATFVALDAGRPTVAYERREDWTTPGAKVAAIDPRDVVAAALRILDRVSRPPTQGANP